MRVTDLLPSRYAASGLLSAARFWHPDRSAIRKRGIIWKSSVQKKKRQISCRSLSAALILMPKLSRAKSHMWSM